MKELTRFREALLSMVFQFGFRGTKDGKAIISTGGLSALEEAFEALCWDDPHYLLDGAAWIAELTVELKDKKP